jgi:regulatory protein
MAQQITALRLQKRNQKRVNVYLDGSYAFAVQKVVAASLSLGQTLSEKEIEGIRSRDAVEAAHDRVLRFLSYRPRSRVEVVRYLERRKVPSEIIDAVVERLVRSGLLDDEAFARYWVDNREQFRPRGAHSLRFELRGKGVPDAVIEQALEGLDETASAYRAAHRKAVRLSQLDYAAFRRRVGGFLQRRGFEYAVVKETVDRLWRESQGGAEEDV